MAQPDDTFSSYDAIGNREDLEDVICDISPISTPFMSAIERMDADATFHEWQTHSLAAASATNAVIEGDDATTDASTATTRLGNYTQISDKVPRVTGTQEAVNKAGRKSELAYEIVRRGRELKRDMESSLLANNARVAGNDTLARELAGVPAWIATNVDKASDGTNPAGTGADARSDGTQRDFEESQLKAVLKLCWDNGGDPDCIMVGSHNKQVASTFQGNATRDVKAEDRKLYASIDVYESDFGVLDIIPNRFMRARDALVLQKDLWGVAYLRPFHVANLAKTGDSERRQLIVEYTLQASNEAGSGIVADLTTS